MWKRTLLAICGVVIYISLIAALCMYVEDNFFDNMRNLPQGELIESFQSPNGSHTANAYLCNGGATVAYSIRVEVVSGAKTRNIYWEYDEDECICEWVSEDVIRINGRNINVLYEAYDWRNK